MTSMFWGLRLDPGKRYSTVVDKSFHVSMAVLDCSTVKADNEIISVMIEEGESKSSFILCNLQKNKLMQSPLDLNFMCGDRITFFCKGSGVVHLSGYIQEDDELGQLGEEEDEEEEEEDDEDEDDDDSSALVKELQIRKGKGKLDGLQGKGKLSALEGPQTKKKKLEIEGEDSDDDDDEDDDDDDDDEDENDDDDDDDDDEDVDDEMESELENKLPTKTANQQMKKNKKNKPQGQQAKATAAPFQNKQKNQPNTTNINKQQNQGKQQKTPNGVSPNVQQKKDKKKGGGGDKSPGATRNNLNKSNEETPSKKVVDTSPKKTLEGGVTVKDIKVGNGPVCKNGKMACVYYTGRFKQNNKVFDSTSEGAGFKFRVGKGDVIKGWDVGLVGMKVGGKRLITCPPHMAYGQKGSPPTIPANSALVFEVELKSIN